MITKPNPTDSALADRCRQMSDADVLRHAARRRECPPEYRGPSDEQIAAYAAHIIRPDPAYIDELVDTAIQQDAFRSLIYQITDCDLAKETDAWAAARLADIAEQLVAASEYMAREEIAP